MMMLDAFTNLINQVRYEDQQGQPLNHEALKLACHIYQELYDQHCALLELAKKMHSDLDVLVQANNLLGDTLNGVCMAFHKNDPVNLAQVVADIQKRLVPMLPADLGIARASVSSVISTGNDEPTPQFLH